MAHKTERTRRSQVEISFADCGNTCSWTDCELTVTDAAKVPLCDGHLRKAWAAQQVLLDSGEMPARPEIEQPASKRRKEGIGWIYFAHIGPHIKIGWSSDPKHRAAGLGAALLTTIPNRTRADEQAMHKQFEPCRDPNKGREYFHPAPALMRYIKDLQEGRSAP